jgi:hypothetical protein
MMDVDLPLMLSLSPEPNSPVHIANSAKSTTKGSIFNEVSFPSFLQFLFVTTPAYLWYFCRAFVNNMIRYDFIKAKV